MLHIRTSAVMLTVVRRNLVVTAPGGRYNEPGPAVEIGRSCV